MTFEFDSRESWSIIEVKIRDVANIEEDFVNKKITIKLKEEKIAEKQLDEKEVLSQIKASITQQKAMMRGNKIQAAGGPRKLKLRVIGEAGSSKTNRKKSKGALMLKGSKSYGSALSK